MDFLFITATLESDTVENGLTQPLLLNSKAKEEDEDQECDGAEEDSNEIQKPITSLVSAYRLLTPSVKVWISSESVYALLDFNLRITKKKKKKRKENVLLHLYLFIILANMLSDHHWNLDNVSVPFHSIYSIWLYRIQLAV